MNRLDKIDRLISSANSSEEVFQNCTNMGPMLTIILDDYANTRVEIDNDYDPIPVEEHIINENKRRSKGMILDFELLSGWVQVILDVKLEVKTRG